MYVGSLTPDSNREREDARNSRVCRMYVRFGHDVETDKCMAMVLGGLLSVMGSYVAAAATRGLLSFSEQVSGSTREKTPVS